MSDHDAAELHDVTPPRGTAPPRFTEPFERQVAREEIGLARRVSDLESAVSQLREDSTNRMGTLLEHHQTTFNEVKAARADAAGERRSNALHVRHATKAIRTLTDEVHGLRSDLGAIQRFIAAAVPEHRKRLDTLGDIAVEHESRFAKIAKRLGWAALALGSVPVVKVLWDLAATVAPAHVPPAPIGH